MYLVLVQVQQSLQRESIRGRHGAMLSQAGRSLGEDDIEKKNNKYV